MTPGESHGTTSGEAGNICTCIIFHAHEKQQVEGETYYEKNSVLSEREFPT